jgi:F0F1-type ATP synthase membrane subunit b/b'
MEILTALGVNTTIWFQLACFLVAFLAVSQLIFKPYLAAHQERVRRTAGQEDSAERVLQEVSSLRTQYETKAREVNSQFKSIYDQSRTEAMREHDRLVTAARDLAAKYVDDNRQKISTEMENARTEIGREAPVVGAAIAGQLIGKDVNA